MLKDNKITGEKEELSYQKDEKGEIYSRKSNGQTLLDSAIEATEESTRTSTINEQVQNIKNRQQERTQPSKENNGIDR